VPSTTASTPSIARASRNASSAPPSNGVAVGKNTMSR
jgi:hypothetical protein